MNRFLNAFAKHFSGKIVEMQKCMYEQPLPRHNIISISAREHCEYILCSCEPIHRSINDIGWMSWKHKIPITPSTPFTWKFWQQFISPECRHNYHGIVQTNRECTIRFGQSNINWTISRYQEWVQEITRKMLSGGNQCSWFPKRSIRCICHNQQMGERED